MGVVMQAAELVDVARAAAWEAELRRLREDYVRFEATDPAPWSSEKVPAPLTAFAARRGMTWPATESARFFLKGSFEDVAEILRVDRVVFFWGNGFELGGATLAAIAEKDGAVRTAPSSCHLRVRCDDGASRAEALAAFLEEEDHAQQFTLVRAEGPIPTEALFSITFEGRTSRRLVFDGSGVQDWAFVAALPQLDGDDPSLVPGGVEAHRP